MIARTCTWAFVLVLLIGSVVVGDLVQTAVVMCAAGSAFALGAALLRMGIRNLRARRSALVERERRIMKALSEVGDVPTNWMTLDTELRVCQRGIRDVDTAAFVIPVMPAVMALGVLASADLVYAVPWSHVLIGIGGVGAVVWLFVLRGPAVAAAVAVIITAVFVVGG